MINSNTYQEKTEYVQSLSTDNIKSLAALTTQTRNIKWEELGFYLRELANRGEVEYLDEFINSLEIQLAEVKTYNSIAKENRKLF